MIVYETLKEMCTIKAFLWVIVLSILTEVQLILEEKKRKFKIPPKPYTFLSIFPEDLENLGP